MKNMMGIELFTKKAWGILGMIVLTHVWAHAAPPEITHSAHLYREIEIHTLNEDVASRFLQVASKNPKGIFFLSAGGDMEGVYKAVVDAFKKDPNLDFSKASFFLIDDFEGLENDHPLSHHFFLQTHFYNPLMRISKERAPNRLQCFSPQDTAYKSTLEAALKNGEQARPELALLTIGAVSPHLDEKGFVTLKGGRVGALEPDHPHDFFVASVALSAHRQKEIAHRFRALETLLRTGEMKGIFSIQTPKRATTLGWQALRSCTQILVIATGEDKNPAISNAFGAPHFEHFPSSLLSTHPEVSWYLDTGSASQLTQRPWHTRSTQAEDHLQILCESAQACEGSPLTKKDLARVGANNISDSDFLKSHAQIKEKIYRWTKEDNFPQGQRVLILSPHPDDDVISMGAAIKHLVEKDNDVRVVYAVTGANAVDDTLPRYAKLYQEAATQNPNQDEKAHALMAKVLVREEEASNAVALLGLSPQNLIFFKADYYQRRGVPGLSPFSPEDLSRMKDLVKDFQPQILFFAAENDPNGAHGLSTQLMAITLDTLTKEQTLAPPKLYGYRGAYAEWPLHTNANLIIHGFDEKGCLAKEKAIKAHISQLAPLYPSFDPRPFYKRAGDRNEASLKQVNALLGTPLSNPSTKEPFVAAEVFQEFLISDFVTQYR